jgi:NDP-sugar pyrophosphorylase family protein
LEILIRQLARDGVDDIRLTVAYQANLIRAMFGDGERWGVRIEYFTEDHPLGTAGCLALQGSWFDRDVLVCNGDLLTNVDFRQIVDIHRQRNAHITICVRPQKFHVPYGVVEFDAAERLTAYREKPTLSYWVSMGIYVVSPAVTALITPGERIDMPDLHLRCSAAERLVHCAPQEGIWYDIGTLDDYDRACQAFAQSPETFLGRARP